MATFDIKKFEEKWRQPKQKDVDAARVYDDVDPMEYMAGDVSQLDILKNKYYPKMSGIFAALSPKKRLPALILADLISKKIPPSTKEWWAKPRDFFPGVREKVIDFLTPGAVTDTGILMKIDNELASTMSKKSTWKKEGGNLRGIAKRKKKQSEKNIEQLQEFFDNNPKFIKKIKTGRVTIQEMIETTGLRNLDGKLLSESAFKQAFKRTKQADGKSPEKFAGYIYPKGAINPEQDTFLLNVIQQRLQEGVPYGRLKGQLQNYIKNNPKLFKKAEELGLTGYSDIKLQDRLKGLFADKFDTSKANQAIINTIKKSKNEKWYNVKEFAGLSETGQKQAHDIKNKIVALLPSKLKDRARVNIASHMSDMTEYAVRAKVPEKKILKELSKIDIGEMAKIQKERIKLQDRISLANKLGITLDKANLSHKLDKLKDWKLTLKGNNLFFAWSKANQQIQVAVNKQIDNLISEVGAANFKKIRLGQNITGKEKEIAARMKKLEQQLIDNNLISIVQGEKFGVKENILDPFMSKRMLSEADEKIKERLSKNFEIDIDDIDTPAVTKAMKQKISEKMFGEPMYFKKRGGIVGIDHLTRTL